MLLPLHQFSCRYNLPHVWMRYLIIQVVDSHQYLSLLTDHLHFLVLWLLIEGHKVFSVVFNQLELFLLICNCIYHLYLFGWLLGRVGFNLLLETVIILNLILNVSFQVIVFSFECIITRDHCICTIKSIWVVSYHLIQKFVETRQFLCFLLN